MQQSQNNFTVNTHMPTTWIPPLTFYCTCFVTYLFIYPSINLLYIFQSSFQISGPMVGVGMLIAGGKGEPLWRDYIWIRTCMKRKNQPWKGNTSKDRKAVAAAEHKNGWVWGYELTGPEMPCEWSCPAFVSHLCASVSLSFFSASPFPSQVCSHPLSPSPPPCSATYCVCEILGKWLNLSKAQFSSSVKWR